MARSDTPVMPPAASSNMAMSMSSMSASTEKPKNKATNSISKQDAESRPTQNRPSQPAATALLTQFSSSDPLMEDVQRDRTRTREKLLNLQRIKLAEQLSNQHKLSIDLEARIVSLQDELARLTSSNEACEAECAKLQRDSDEVVLQLAVQTAEASQRDETILNRLRGLESELDEATKNLEQPMPSRDSLQSSYDEAIETCEQQEDKIKQLDHELGKGQAKIHDLTAKLDGLQELYDNDVNFKIKNLEKSHELRERDLRQHFDLKDTEAKGLKKELDNLRAVYAGPTFQRKQKLIEERNQSREECSKLQQSLDELQKSTKPFDQMVVICVDISGSLTRVIHEIKQAYRDVLHMIKSVNSDAGVAVVVHGSFIRHEPSPIQAISHETFQFVDSAENSGGTEDYTYCLKQAYNLLTMDVGSKKLLILIGDGNANCSNAVDLSNTCKKLASAKILAHLIILHNGSHLSSSTMHGITDAIGGHVTYKDTYLLVVDGLLRDEREKYFEALQL
ncbi:hypothetical protein F4781DRAFT_441422 [Annulohypoxylon bovei var. microspora]|nr:hypothetical protein F4781DRAFT_441422 [Annulohypoxylon bovei var. microspora]